MLRWLVCFTSFDHYGLFPAKYLFHFFLEKPIFQSLLGLFQRKYRYPWISNRINGIIFFQCGVQNHKVVDIVGLLIP